jgi:hypothetical protein
LKGFTKKSNGASMMVANDNEKKRPRPGRMEALRDLPGDIMRRLTKDEIKAFLFEEEWPFSLREKLKDYLVDDQQGPPS